MSFVVAKYRNVNGKKYGPYYHEVESVWENGKPVQKHVAYLGTGAPASGGLVPPFFMPAFW